MTISGSVRINKGWNPSAGDVILSNLPTPVGYQAQPQRGTQGKTLILALRSDGSLHMYGDGVIADWPVGTFIYLNSTWVIA